MTSKTPECNDRLSEQERVACEEYAAVRRDAGVLDLCETAKLRITGRDRAAYLHNMLSNDIRALRPGCGCHALLLTHQGKMESDLYAYAFKEELWLECPSLTRESVLRTLTKYIVASDVKIEDQTQNLGILSLQGPESLKIMERQLAVSLAPINALEHRSFAQGAQQWFIVRRDRTGCDGYDLWLPREEIPALWARLVDAENIKPVGQTALNWLRTEAGIPWFGADMDSQSLPMEFGLESAVSLTKGCYRGQEIMARISHRGQLDRRLGGVAIGHSALPRPGAEIQSEGARVGRVASSAFSPRLGRPLALAVLKTACLHAGTRVGVVYEGDVYPADVVTLPLP